MKLMVAADQSFYYGLFLTGGRLFSRRDGGAVPVNRVHCRDVRERCVKFWCPPSIGLGGGGEVDGGGGSEYFLLWPIVGRWPPLLLPRWGSDAGEQGRWWDCEGGMSC